MGKLTTTNHSRNVAGLKYIYPVMSRRAGGLSIGINFNTNNACNWRCVYCQVPDLVRGSAPELDLPLLERELSFFLDDVMNGSFYDHYEVPQANRVIKDIAISGNGEPTSIGEFDKAISLIGETIITAGVKERHQFVLITNGSLIHKSRVQKGLNLLNKYHGQVWFKLDSATQKGRKFINNAAISEANCLENLLISARLCPTWLQTCLLSTDGQNGDVDERNSYLQLLTVVIEQVKIQGVMLYTLARPSMQPEAGRLEKLSEQQLNEFAQAIRRLGVEVRVSI
jgi:wyosine [tRNA(Phe)-imidazoG37] synthetase (radical SAM superfamily)